MSKVTATGAAGRVVTDGKHLAVDGRAFRVRGVTYGTFLSRLDGAPFPERVQLKKDLAAMAGAGLNVLRTYTTPVPELLDLAGELGLRVIAGVHYADWRLASTLGRRAHRQVLDAGRRAVDEAMTLCAGRSEVLAVSVGNEVPADLVRLHGVSAVEDVLGALAAEVHAADDQMLATYSNFPSTEYLRIDGLDFASFNVFLERPEAFRAYLRHLQVVTGDIPLLLTELGLASDVHGWAGQAEALEWQLRIADETGCAGAAVFSWTDEWGVDGQQVEGWGFGITAADRTPKPALDTVERWAGGTAEALRATWPPVSVVVCAYNEERRLAECLQSLTRVDYPDLDVIVCDDGSTDGTLAVARRFPFRIVELPHGGLSAARNAGLAAATGDVIAYLDADASCHPEWIRNLVLALGDDGVAAAGGPNLPFPGAGTVERAVARCPGNPIHVLVADDRAEHVPGCNMAFRRAALERIGGFDPRYVTAGDDVDVCWRLLDEGRQIAFAPAAQVIHHRRDSVRGYLRQQRGYGRAERIVAQHHAHRFNRLGHARWAGFIYGGPRLRAPLLRPVIYHGLLGLAPYQGIARHRSEQVLAAIGAYLPLGVPLAGLGLVLSLWSMRWLALPVLIALLLGSYAAVVALATRPTRDEPRPLALRCLVGALHVLGPLARTWGRTWTPVRSQPVAPANGDPVEWDDRAAWVRALERGLRTRRCAVGLSDPHSRWDLSVSVGGLLSCRIATAVVWQSIPVHRWVVRPRAPMALLVAAVAIATLAGVGGLWVAGMAAVVAATAVGEYAVLRQRVRAVLDSTTRAHRGIA